MSSRRASTCGSFGSAPLRRRHRRALSAAIVATAFAASLSACSDQGGFHPLYATANGHTYDERLAAVEIAPIPGRVGQRIRNEIVFNRSTGDNAVEPDRRLEISITELLLTTLVEASGSSSSQIYQLEARYQLIDIKTKKKLFEGRSLGRASFDRFESIYSNVRARDDAENRAAKTVAEEIKSRLITFMSRPT